MHQGGSCNTLSQLLAKGKAYRYPQVYSDADRHELLQRYLHRLHACTRLVHEA